MIKKDKKGEIHDKQKNLAKYVIVFMVRGLFSKLCFAFGHFVSEGFNGANVMSGYKSGVQTCLKVKLDIHSSHCP